MKRMSSINNGIRFLIMFSVVYAVLEFNIAFLTPILTIVLPYRFMNSKNRDELQDKKLLTNLFMFNFICLVGAVFVTKNLNFFTFYLGFNILLSFIYFKMSDALENKSMNMQQNPDAVYDKIKSQIKHMENLYKKTEQQMEMAKTEKDRLSIQRKLNALKYNIDNTKRKLEAIEMKINNK